MKFIIASLMAAGSAVSLNKWEHDASLSSGAIWNNVSAGVESDIYSKDSDPEYEVKL